MGYRLLADLVVVLHVAYLALLIAGAALAVRWPKLLWLQVPSAVWALIGVTIGVECPLTALEQSLRRRADGHAYRGGFIKHYITGHLYPRAYAPAVGAAIAVVVALSYLSLWRHMERARQPVV